MTFDIKNIDLERFRNSYIDALKMHLNTPIASYCYSPNALTPEEKCVFIGVEKGTDFNIENENLSDERIMEFLKFHLSRFDILKKMDVLDYAYKTTFIYDSIKAGVVEGWKHLWTKSWPASNETRFKSYEESKNTPGCATFELPPRFKVNMSK